RSRLSNESQAGPKRPAALFVCLNAGEKIAEIPYAGNPAPTMLISCTGYPSIELNPKKPRGVPTVAFPLHVSNDSHYDADEVSDWRGSGPSPKKVIMKDLFVADLKANQPISTTFLVKSKDVKSKKSGEPYLALILGDRSG